MSSDAKSILGTIGERKRDRGRLYTYRYTVTTDQNDSCIKMGSDGSKNHNRTGQCHQCPQSTLNLFEEKGEPKRNRAEALLLTSVTLVHRTCAETAPVMEQQKSAVSTPLPWILKKSAIKINFKRERERERKGYTHSESVYVCVFVRACIRVCACVCVCVCVNHKRHVRSECSRAENISI